MKEIEIDGKQYPCRITMGALRRYKSIEGEDVSKMGNDVAKVSTLLFCCVASACNADGIEFDMKIDDFADRISINQVAEFADAMSVAPDKKK